MASVSPQSGLLNTNAGLNSSLFHRLGNYRQLLGSFGAMFGWGVVSSSKHFSVFPLSMLPGKTIYSYGYLSVIASLWSLWEANDLLCPGGGHGWIPIPSLSRPHASLPEGLTLPACPARGQLPHREEIIQPGLLNFSSFSSSSFKVLLTTAFSRTVAGCGGDGTAGGFWRTLRCSHCSLNGSLCVLTGQRCSLVKTPASGMC